MQPELILAFLMLAAAFLYSSVGHAGASGYLAAMALIGMSGGMMKPTALILNIIVATIALVQFCRAQQFSWRILWPFAVTSLPGAFVGGMLPGTWPGYRRLVGLVLAVSAVKLLWDSRGQGAAAVEQIQVRDPPIAGALAWGAAIGLVAGLTGTGGGIFLSPLLIFMGWGRTRQSGGVSAAFILMNSVAGLIGNGLDLGELSPWMPLWAIAVVIGGFAGSYLGSTRSTPPIFKRLLALVLLVAAGKLIAT